MTALQTLPAEMLIALGGLFGCLVGSFLNVVAYRLPRIALAEIEGRAPDFSLSFPASHCPACDATLSWRENIPLLSFLAQGGKCRHCAAGIPLRYPILEAMGALLGAAAIWRFGFTVEGGAAAAFLLTLLVLAAIDLETGLLPDRATLPLLWAGLLLAAFGFGPEPRDALLGAALGYGLLEGLNRLCRLAIGRDGLGGGDAKLAAALGAWLGPVALASVLLLAFVLGAVYGVTRSKKAASDAASVSAELPFGPWLALAGASALLWPNGFSAARGWLMAGGF